MLEIRWASSPATGTRDESPAWAERAQGQGASAPVVERLHRRLHLRLQQEGVHWAPMVPNLHETLVVALVARANETLPPYLGASLSRSTRTTGTSRWSISTKAASPSGPNARGIPRGKAGRVPM